MKLVARKLAAITVNNELSTVLEVLACVVLSSLNDKFELGYNLKVPLCNFMLISVRSRFSLATSLENEFGSVLVPNWLLETSCLSARGRSKGKGFAGVMKRHNFSGLRQSHGVSLSHRSCGAIGARQDPGKVWKGKKMAGRMGGSKVTVKNLELIRYDPFSCRILLRGSVPGSTRFNVIISD
ncbi:50S ribosomal subunit protein L3 [Candidatus Hodgkinia cicadicola]|nr:50S ribosomal subunit protein L3 [Candidatus Hodgkinia cicadicola]